jgi:glutamyl-tRNA synthetase
LDDVAYDDATFDKVIRNDPAAHTLLRSAIARFETSPWTTDVLHGATLELGEPLGMALRKSQAPIRCAVTGTSVGPPLFESMELLGREKVLQRLRDALVRADA